MGIIIIIGIIAVIAVVAVIVVSMEGQEPPKPESMSYQDLIVKIQVEEQWISKYKALPYQNKNGEAIKNKYEKKQLYLMQLNLEVMKKRLVMSGEEPDEAMILVLKNSIELMKKGVPEDEAMKQSKSPIMKRNQELIDGGLNEQDAFNQARKEFVDSHS